MTADVRHGLFLAVKEALNVAVKHAGATEVWVRVRLGPGRLDWVVKYLGKWPRRLSPVSAIFEESCEL